MLLLILEALIGPSFFSVNSIYNDGFVPVYPKTEHWETVDGDQKTSHSCTMIPLQLSYAWTIWKAQGQTVKSKIVVVIGNTEREHSLTTYHDSITINKLCLDYLESTRADHKVKDCCGYW